ncbi:UvrD-helicase domain-containing protein [Brevibacillus choshinensis]|uniref:UvrD-helicase domain-containing protein n=1 Tax=Brevibacillus choshinensis TaxID=54911 RepID=UPI002E22D731|nr:UvrD-helicase domain-containing protein [Brevibacillus choshinensis]MED4779352.1 UvrD-helicase domain-containing protein [Brevibacillus choshinensis]
MFYIDDNMIEFTERLLLPQGNTFDDERRNVIRCMESNDIQACPGSGKTTALLAKLTILARQLPLKSNQGVCVLTHTNVAVDEIRDRLEGQADILFQYPNHFGTIQSFVNRFLAIPAYIDMFGKRPARIDDEFFREYTERRARFLDRGVKFWLDKNRISLIDLRFNKNDFSISKSFDGPILMKPNSKSYPLLKEFKTNILQQGVLCYDDAYALAYYYLRKYPNIKEILSERFVYSFIDEMQDTDSRQNDLLERCFDSTRVVIQKIGDRNQSIFNSPSEEGWNVTDDCLSISDSKRFSRAIAEKVKNICLVPQDLKGNLNVPDIAPKLLIYNDETILNVIPKFGDLIFEYRLHEMKKTIYKAIGWVSQGKERRTIPSYFQSYGLPDVNKKQDFYSLCDYLKMAVLQQGDSIKQKHLLIYRGILKSLRLSGVNSKKNVPYTQATLTQVLKIHHKDIYDHLNEKLVQWCMQLFKREDIITDVKDFITAHLCPALGGTHTSELSTFLNGPSLIQHADGNQKTNLFIHERDNLKIPIQISTVHSVKGETHTATLYLETFYRMYDIESIMEYMKGNHNPPRRETVSHALKMAYVGMTRPTHLLCVAAHQNGCEPHIQGLEDAGWDIIRV